MNALFLGIGRVQEMLFCAQAEAAAAAPVDESMKTDPVGVPIIFLICLAVPVALIGRFHYGKGLCTALGIVFGLIDAGITVPAMLAGMSGVSLPLALAVGLGSGALVVFLVSTFGQRMGSWFGSHETPRKRPL